MKGLRYYGFGDYVKRFAWWLAGLLVRLVPRHFRWLRNTVLRLFGAKIGERVCVFPSTKIAFPWNLTIGRECTLAWGVTVYNLGPVQIGDRVVISQGTHLCGGTHDYEKSGFLLVKSAIVIEDDVWIAADAFIGPGVRVGRGAVIGARAVVTKDVPPQAVMAGNPARQIRVRKLERQW